MVACSKDSSGQVVMALASFYFTASAKEEWNKSQSAQDLICVTAQVSLQMYLIAHQLVVSYESLILCMAF